jgi:hypothetical protein
VKAGTTTSRPVIRHIRSASFSNVEEYLSSSINCFVPILGSVAPWEKLRYQELLSGVESNVTSLKRRARHLVNAKRSQNVCHKKLNNKNKPKLEAAANIEEGTKPPVPRKRKKGSRLTATTRPNYLRAASVPLPLNDPISGENPPTLDSVHVSSAEEAIAAEFDDLDELPRFDISWTIDYTQSFPVH